MTPDSEKHWLGLPVAATLLHCHWPAARPAVLQALHYGPPPSSAPETINVYTMKCTKRDDRYKERLRNQPGTRARPRRSRGTRRSGAPPRWTPRKIHCAWLAYLRRRRPLRSRPPASKGRQGGTVRLRTERDRSGAVVLLSHPPRFTPSRTLPSHFSALTHSRTLVYFPSVP